MKTRNPILPSEPMSREKRCLVYGLLILVSILMFVVA